LPYVLTVSRLFIIGILNITLLLVFKVLLDLDAFFKLPGLINLCLKYYTLLDYPSLYILDKEPYNQRSPRFIYG
jgi:hypothetical protein